jgi:hypothetical protein
VAKPKHNQDWAEAKKLCRLNQNDIEMAKRLGFQPRSLIRSRPDPKQKWKLPVKYLIHELHFKRFGHVIGEKPLDLTPPTPPPPKTEEEMRRLEEQFFWEDYHDRNSDPPPKRKRSGQTAAPAPAQPRVELTSEEGACVEPWPVFPDSDNDSDVPF